MFSYSVIYTPFPGRIRWNHWCMGFTCHQTIKEWKGTQWSAPNHVHVPRTLREWWLCFTSGQSRSAVVSAWLHISTNSAMWPRHLQHLQLSDGRVTAASSRWCLSSIGFVPAFKEWHNIGSLIWDGLFESIQSEYMIQWLHKCSAVHHALFYHLSCNVFFSRN